MVQVRHVRARVSERAVRVLVHLLDVPRNAGADRVVRGVVLVLVMPVVVPVRVRVRDGRMLVCVRVSAARHGDDTDRDEQRCPESVADAPRALRARDRRARPPLHER